MGKKKVILLIILVQQIDFLAVHTHMQQGSAPGGIVCEFAVGN